MIAYFKRRIRASLGGMISGALAGQEAQSVRSGTPLLAMSQHALMMHYRTLVAQNLPLPSIFDTGFRVLSQCDEDGLLLFLFSILGTRHKTFVDIGASDGINSNCANLALNLGWHGLFIDGDHNKVRKGRQFYSRHPDTFLFPPTFVQAKVTRENVNEVVASAGLLTDVDLLSIDVDGNDYWIWDSLEVITPRVVIIETHVEFGRRDIVVPYDPEYAYPGVHPQYHGASVGAMAKLAARKGYRLVGANRYGFNTIYVREDVCGKLIPEISVDDVLQHPRNEERQEMFYEIEHLPFIKV